MPHGTEQAVAGLGDGSVIGTGGNAADADNRLASLAQVLDIEASEVDVDSSTLVGTGTDVQAVFEELDDAAATALATNNTQDTYKPLYSTLTADSADRNNSEVMLASGLTVTVVAATYEVEAFLPYTTAAAADLELKFGGTATVTGTVGTSDLWIVNKPTGDATAGLALASLLPTSWTTAFSVLTTGAPADGSPVIVRGKLVVTGAGTIIIEFTQDVADVSNTHIGAGAWLKLQRVA